MWGGRATPRSFSTAGRQAGGDEAGGVGRRITEPSVTWVPLGPLRPEQVSSGHGVPLLSPHTGSQTC